MTLVASNGSSNAGALAQKWAYTAAPGSSTTLAQFLEATDAEATTFMYLNCLKQHYSGKGTKKSISTFLGMLAMSPLRKFASFGGAAIFAPVDQAFLDNIDYLGEYSLAPSGGPILPSLTAAQANAVVALQLVPDSALQSSVEDGPRLAMEGTDPGVLGYDRDAMASTDGPWLVNSTMNAGQIYHFGYVTSEDAACSYVNGPTLYIVDSVLGCNGTGDACPLAVGFGGVEYKPAVNANGWNLPASYLP